jgi:serine/threonine protein kinase
MSHDHSMDARGEDSAPSGRQRLDDGDLMSLPPSTVLDGRYEITALLGSGGFSIVYEARDLHAGGQTVALKEFFPSQICIRIGSHTVSLRSQREQAVFEQGLRAFLHEARLLRNLDHVGIVRVHNWFEANGTAYIVMKRLRGETLLQRLVANRLPDETTLRTWLGRILSSLELLHEHGVLHRDINPSNIFLTESDDPVLIDFGAARQCMGKVSQSLNQIASAGYSPLEQYDEAGLEEQKPPTDIYALGATLYHVVTRTRPAASTSRAPRDRLRPAAEIAAGRYSPAFLGRHRSCHGDGDGKALAQ